MHRTKQQKRDYDKKRYAENREKIIKQRQAHYRENKESILAYTRKWTKARLAEMKRVMLEAKDKPCCDCGVKYPPYIMDFDHRIPSEKCGNISQLVRNWKMNPKKLLIEIEKCDLVCSNCHRERSFQRGYGKDVPDREFKNK